MQPIGLLQNYLCFCNEKTAFSSITNRRKRSSRKRKGIPDFACVESTSLSPFEIHFIVGEIIISIGSHNEVKYKIFT